MTEAKNQEIQRILQSTQARLRTDLIALISHDAPTPLIQLYTDFMAAMDKGRAMHKIIADVGNDESKMQALMKIFVESVKDKNN